MGTLYSARAKRKVRNRETAREALVQIASVTNSAAAAIVLDKAVDPKWVKQTLEEIAKAILSARLLIS